MTIIQDLIDGERARIGVEIGPTRWRDVRQDDISAFGACTYDPDPMHTDVEWAKRHSPFGGTIAFGFWTVSMLTSLLGELAEMARAGAPSLPHEQLIGINYGCDRLRFIEPVPVGGRIRARSTLVSVERAGPDRYRRAADVVVEVDGQERPALVARWLSATLLPEPGVQMAGFRRAG